MAETNPGASHRLSFKRLLAPLAILLAASAGTAVFWLTGGACSGPDSPTDQPPGVHSRGDCTEICPELADGGDEEEAEVCATSAGQTAELRADEYTALRSGLPPGMGQAAPGVGTISRMGDEPSPSTSSGNLTR
jgi:hypothetical protein